MGTLNIVQLSLPYFRVLLVGFYVIFFINAGHWVCPAGLGLSCAIKYAIESNKEYCLRS